MSKNASVYGEALYSLAREERIDDIIRKQLDVLDRCFGEEPDYLRLLGNPGLSKVERIQILEDCFRGKVNGYLLNFLKILMEKGYIRYFFDCTTSFREFYDWEHGILHVSALTAVPMTVHQEQKLTKTLEKLTGKHIKLTVTADPTILGGMKLDYDGKRVDGTVSHRLDEVRSLLKNTVL